MPISGSKHLWLRILLVSAVVAVLGGCRWQTVWTRSQQPSGAAAAIGQTIPELSNQTVRSVVRFGQSGSLVRFRLQNTFGNTQVVDGNNPVTIDHATIAIRTAGGSIDPSTLRQVTFAGRRSVALAPGASVDSDTAAIAVTRGTDVAISLYAAATQTPAAHVLSLVTQYVSASGSGDHTEDAGGSAFAPTTLGPFFVSNVQVVTGDQAHGSVVVAGGSVVDGFQATVDGYDNLVDDLQQRVATELPMNQRVPVVNAGIGGTTAAQACAVAFFGPGLESRLERDVLSLGHVTRLLVWAGTNDLSFGCTSGQIIAALTSISTQMKATGGEVTIATITPRSSYTPAQNLSRAAVNDWILDGANCGGACDHAVDFDAVLRDPANPNQINPAYDSGDHFHPNPAGYAALAASVDVATLVG